MNRRARLVLLIVGLVVATYVVLTVVIESDTDAIKRVTNSCRVAFLSGDVEGIRVHLADEAVYARGVVEESLSSVVEQRLAREGKRVADIALTLREIEVDGDDARATWRVAVRLRPRRREPIPRGSFDVRVEYRREPEDWKVTRVEMIRL
jgi:hypothetical protein